MTRTTALAAIWAAGFDAWETDPYCLEEEDCRVTIAIEDRGTLTLFVREDGPEFPYIPEGLQDDSERVMSALESVSP